MRVLDGDWAEWAPSSGPTALTIGVYDGVHRGHQAVLASLREAGGELPIAVLTFDGHPLQLSAPDHAPALLTTRDQKLELLEQAGVDLVGVLRFDQHLRTLSPQDFTARVVVGVMRARLVVVGADFRFGHERAGDVDLLKRLGEELEFDVLGIQLVGDGAPISSTAVRQVLHAGNVALATEMLGRPYELRGVVVPGDGRGRAIGVPTANLDVSPTQLLPRLGVYAVFVVIAGIRHKAVANVGVRPTFGGTREIAEVHVLGYDGDLYGHELAVQFIRRIRDEQRFEGVGELVAQIHRDIEVAADHLAAIAV